jgi:hypothetical protein
MVTGIKIDPESYYDDGAVCKLIHCTPTRLSRYCSQRGLRSTKHGDRRFFKGQWLIEWLEGEPLEANA